MKRSLATATLPGDAIFVTCSSHEERCKGGLTRAGRWSPSHVVLFHYDDYNPIREEHHAQMEAMAQAIGAPWRGQAYGQTPHRDGRFSLHQAPSSYDIDVA